MTDVRLTATNPVDSSVVPVACNEKGELKLEEPILVEGPQGEKGDKGDPGDPGADGDPFTGTFSGDVTFNGNQTLNGTFTCGASSLTQSGSVVVSNGTYTLWTDTSTGISRWGSNVDLNEGRIAIQLSGADGTAHFVGGTCSFQSNSYETADSQPRAVGNLKAGWLQSHVPSDWPAPDVDSQWSSFAAFSRSNVLTIALFADGSAQFSQDVIVGSRNQRWVLVESGGLCHMVAADSTTLDVSPASQLPEIPQLRNIPAELTMVEEQLQKVMERLKMVPEAGWEVWDGED